jgi:trigger factor
MTITREDLNPCTVKLSIVCDASDVSEAVRSAVKEISKQVKVPGFRPGKAPTAMVESLVSKEAVYQEALDRLVRVTFKKALDEHSILPDPSVRPFVEVRKLDLENNEAEYEAQVGLPPIVQLGETAGLSVERPVVEVEDAEVDYRLEDLRGRRAKREQVTDRGVEEGDVAVVNITLSESGESKNFMTVVGKTFPQLDAALLGMQVEETKVMELVFPANFQEKTWAGQTLQSTVRLNSLNAVRMPELDDAFAQELNADSVEELRSRIREGIMRLKLQVADELVEEQLFDRMVERSQVDMSDNMWQNVARIRIQEWEEELKRRGKTVEEHAQENGMTKEEWAASVEKGAQDSTRQALVVRHVFETQALTLDNTLLNEALQQMASEFQMSAEDLLKQLQEQNMMNELHYRAVRKRVAKFLLEQAQVTDVRE